MTLQEELAKAQQKVKQVQDKINQDAAKNKHKNVFDEIDTLDKVYDKLGITDEVKNDSVNLAGFTTKDYECLNSLIARMRISKVYNQGKTPTRADRRWYPWSYVPAGGSGLVFHCSFCIGDYAFAGSAARLAFLSEQASTAYFKNFQKVEEGIIQL